MNGELLKRIENLHSGKIKFSDGTLFKSSHTVELNFVTDVAPQQNLESEIASVCKEYLPKSIASVDVRVRKIITQKEFVVSSTLEFLKKKHTFCSQIITDNDIIVDITEKNVLVKLNVESSLYSYFLSKNVCGELKTYLESVFVDEFEISLEDAGEVAVDESKLQLKLTENDLRKTIIRTLKVDDVTRLFDNDLNPVASYICDTKDMCGEVYLAGVVTNVREALTKKEKPYYIIDFNDRTGSTSGTVFPTKAELPKVQKIVVGSEIIIHGEFEIRNGYHNLRINSINYCAFPKNFVPVARPKRPVPKEYSIIFPQKLVLENQSNFLVDDSIPECFNGRRFVVFDLETTGIDNDDKITEIGAVTIEDGKITTYFSTLVNPLKHIPQNVEDLTGINDDMVKDAPIFDEVVGDFYKYCEGSTLVAHNIEFDSKFIRRQSAPLDFIFDHPLMDTLALGREVIKGVPNYKLNTLCDKFGITFIHHRAYADALACAKLLIEIIKIRKDLPF